MFESSTAKFGVTNLTKEVEEKNIQLNNYAIEKQEFLGRM